MLEEHSAVDVRQLSSPQKERFITGEVFRILKLAGQPLLRSEIIEALSDQNDSLAEYIKLVRTSQKTNNRYRPFDFEFNYAVKNLIIADLVSRHEKIALTNKGINTKLADFDVERDVYQTNEHYWQQHKKQKKASSVEDKPVDSGESLQDKINEELKQKILQAIAAMSPAKFETFSRALLTKMGVEFTAIGVQISGDGGIDGFGYHRDKRDFRTSRVVIQCKRFNVGSVSSQDIDKFLGAMNKFQADYGIFITNSRFTVAARQAAQAGTPITLIDGNELAELVIAFQLYLIPIKTFELDEFYLE